MTDTIQLNARGIDLSPRIARSTTVAASPAAASETTIATVTLPGNLTVVSGVLLVGWCAFTVGTNGTGANLKLRQTGTSGTTLAASGLVTETAANLDSRSIVGFDTAPADAQVYVLTLTVANGSAISTVSAVGLVALAI